MNEFRNYIGKSTKDFDDYEEPDRGFKVKKNKPHHKWDEDEEYYQPKKKKRK